ncbi:MAG: glutamate 5-kinase [Nitrospirae bacterium]|nr:glutamate 5-kinase [Nitrospirota bacterium]
MRQDVLESCHRIVVKIGSGLLAPKGRGLQTAWIEQLARDVAALRAGGREVILVSSGAIAAGIERLGLAERPATIARKQAAAAVGQGRLMAAYDAAFSSAGLTVAQVLLTHGDLADRKRFLNARTTLTTLLEAGVVPIINENDTVAVEELKFGENDHLAALVTNLVGAQLFVILSGVEGFCTGDPTRDPSATLIPLVTEITPLLEAHAKATGSAEGTGGMVPKLAAAKQATAHGTATIIAGGRRPNVLVELLAGGEIGTLFLPTQERLKSRKHWIAYTLHAKGRLHLDEGAARALRQQGRSLLPSGVREVEGKFQAGEAVSCVGPDGREVARGLSNYSADEVVKIRGAKSREISSRLGYKLYDEVIHRDNLVVLQ